MPKRAQALLRHANFGTTMNLLRASGRTGKGGCSRRTKFGFEKQGNTLICRTFEDVYREEDGRIDLWVSGELGRIRTCNPRLKRLLRL